MALDTLIREFELAADAFPLEDFSRKLSAGPLLQHWSASSRDIVRSYFLLDLIGDDDIIVSLKAIGNGWILLINQPLFLSFEPKLIFLACLHLNKSHTISKPYYYSSHPFRWFSTLYISIYFSQLSHDPTIIRP